MCIRDRSPRWAFAYKYQPENARAELLSVDYQVGRSGIVTPVANVEPVLISGTVVRRATLHNEEFIKSLDLHYHDYVYIEKGGEIIPKTVSYTHLDVYKRQLSERVLCCST